ncbi:MAG TPA: hypothetical protein VHV10_20595 [Ktedonobacteraceae bacterium]|jgi:hypothetical protein|nr:hypothetical protein [Ktedonobacteraceae bacterium]
MHKGYFTGYDVHQAYRRAFSRPKKSWRNLTLRSKYIFAMIAGELNDLLEKERRNI